MSVTGREIRMLQARLVQRARANVLHELTNDGWWMEVAEMLLGDETKVDELTEEQLAVAAELVEGFARRLNTGTPRVAHWGGAT